MKDELFLPRHSCTPFPFLPFHPSSPFFIFMRLANPLYYPLPILVGSIVLVLGVRVVRLPNLVIVPVSAAIAILGATVRKSQEPESLNVDNPELARQLQSVQLQARTLADRANALRSEAANLLTDAAQMELLVAVQYACDRANELPAKVSNLARRMQGTDSLLSVEELREQLAEVDYRLRTSSGVAQEQLQRLAESLRRNIQLAQQGQDARQAQVVSLSTLIQDSAGVLQTMQNQLRTANLADATETEELRSLSDELRQFQDNVDLLVSK
jgi:chromosome segregation ATPase